MLLADEEARPEGEKDGSPLASRAGGEKLADANRTHRRIPVTSVQRHVLLFFSTSAVIPFAQLSRGHTRGVTPGVAPGVSPGVTPGVSPAVSPGVTPGVTLYDWAVGDAHVAIYAGSFDPITCGHLDVVQRARTLFDRLIVGIGRNPDKPTLFDFDDRVAMADTLVSELVAADPRGAAVSVEKYTGLTVDFAREAGAVALIRGIRNVTDLAMECQLAITNRQVADIETVFVVTGEAYAFTSSSLIRQVAALGGDVDRLEGIVPPLVIRRLKKLQGDPHGSLRSLADDAHME